MTNPASFRAGDETGGLEDPEVLQESRQRDRMRMGELGDGGGSAGQAGEDRPADRVGEGAEGGVEGRLRLNHMVNLGRRQYNVNRTENRPLAGDRGVTAARSLPPDRLVEVLDQVIDLLDPHRQPNQRIGEPHRLTHRHRHRGMGLRGGMPDQALDPT